MKHFLTLRSLETTQIHHLLKTALRIKHQVKANSNPALSLSSKTLAMIFAKPSTRTRVSAETGWAWYGGHPLFLGKSDIQLGSGEPLSVTAKVVSSMADCILARVGDHSEIEEIAAHSSVPVINALTAKYHPLQILADLMTLYEIYIPETDLKTHIGDMSSPLPNLPLKLAWVGDSNNILNSMIVTLPRFGIHLKIATPETYPVDSEILTWGRQFGEIDVSFDPVIAVKDVDVVVTDTWISMGQESERVARLEAFKGYQITESLLKNAKKDAKFMHCLPRKMYEVDDEVFEGHRSLVYQEAENRKYTVMAVYEKLMQQ